MLDPTPGTLAACPVVAAPRFGKLPDEWPAHHRGPAAGSCRPASTGSTASRRSVWTRQPCAPALRRGAGTSTVQLRPLPIKLIEEFVAYGREHLPNEVAGVLIYSRSTGRLRLSSAMPNGHRQFGSITAGRRWRETRRWPWTCTPRSWPAFWSADDDRDDQGIAVAGVFGLLDQPAPMACFQLVINGLYKTLPRHRLAGAEGAAIRHG